MPQSIERIAEELGLTVVRRFADGEFGATLVRRGDSDLVLKVIGSAEWLSAVTRGSGIANRLWAAGYPAPEYLGVGTFEGSTWTLQRLLPGTVPDRMTAAHAEQLLALAKRHAGFGESTFDWQGEAIRQTRHSLEIVRAAAPGLAGELSTVLDRTARTELRRGDVVHCDFHHRNYLADGERVTGIFDWEIATPGDWRFDLVTLAFWTSTFRAGASADAIRLIGEEARAACGPEVLALMTAVLAARQLAFNAQRHPDRFPRFQEALQSTAAPWWRDVL